MKKSHPRYEQTLIIMKPDSIQRSLVGEIISRYERSGLKLIAMKMIVPTSDMIEKHYTLDPEWRRVTGEKTIKSFHDKGLKPPHENPLDVTNILLKRLCTYMTSGPIIVMIWEGAHSVAIVRKLTGGTEPLTSDVGTIRGDYVLDSYQMTEADGRCIRNLVHASGSVKEAQDEIQHWFSDKEIINYNHIQEKIIYDINLDGLPE